MFGIDLFDASLLPAIMVALTAGALSFLSPCVLPIVPPYLAYMGGDHARRAGRGPARGAAQGASGGNLLRAGAVDRVHLPGVHGFVLRAVLLAEPDPSGPDRRGPSSSSFGLHFLGVINIPILNREARLDAGDRGGSALGAYVLGLAFAFGWTPCIGPQLGAILSIAATETSVERGTTLLAVYAIGLGIPFLLAAAFIDRAMGVMARLKPHMKTIERAMGLLLVAVGTALITGAFSAFAFWLLETFPALALLG